MNYSNTNEKLYDDIALWEKTDGIDCSPVCQKEVGEKVAARGIKNIILINKEVHNLQDFADDSLDLVLLYDALHGGDGTCPQKGIHWEKCHTLYYIKKGIITFDSLEKVDVMNFTKL